MRNKIAIPYIWDRSYHPCQTVLNIILETFNEVLAKKPNAVLIDYGCGNTPYKTFIINKLKDYIGVDLAINHECDIVLTDSGGLPFEADKADIILST